MSKKICIITDSLSSGGAEKIAANMSLLLVKKGYEVFVVSMMDMIDYKFGGTLYNFGLVKNQNNKLSAFFKFKRFFQKHAFDVVVDHRIRNKFIKELLFSRSIFHNDNLLYCIHHYDLSYYFTAPKFPYLSRLVHARNRKFISVSEHTKKHVKQELNIDSILIHNYAIIPEFKSSENNKNTEVNNYVVGVGRLEEVKQFDVLIKSYGGSELPKNGIKLLILGEGSQKENLQRLIKELKLDNDVQLLGFQNNPFVLILNAKALVMSSRYEGFPMVLIEALALEVPLVSFDCKTGPNEIIRHNHNGLLVSDQNIEALTNAMNKLIMDTIFYNKIKFNIKKDVFQFSEEKIATKWIEVIESVN